MFAAKTRRLKFWRHLLFAYISRYKIRILAAILLASVAVFGTYQLAPLIFRRNIVNIGYVGAYTLESLPTEILYLAARPLVTKDDSGKIIPSLASHWTISEDGKTYILFLRDNISWHDGTPVEAEDISLAIQNVQITALNNKAIEFKLPNPTVSFLQALDTPVFKKRTFYGIGDFRITDINQVDNIVKKISLVPNDKKLPRVEIKFYPTEEFAINALKLGEVKNVNVSNAKSLENWPNLDVQKEIDKTEIVTIFYNTQSPILSSKDTRQALAYAINKEGFDGQNAHSPISYISWAYNPETKKYDYNLGRAKELFAKAELQNAKITLSYLAGFADVAKRVEEDWEALGLTIDIKEERTVPDEFEALIAINKLPADPDQYPLWHSTQKETNITKLANVRIDKVLEDGRSTQNENERKEIYSDFQQFLQEEAPAVFLYNPYKYKLSYKNAQDLLSKLPKQM